MIFIFATNDVLILSILKDFNEKLHDFKTTFLDR